MMKKIMLAVAFIFALWFGGMLNEWLFAPDVGVVLLSNESSEAIPSIQVAVCGQEFNALNIPTGKYAVVRYDVTFDSHYDVTALLHSGQTLESEIGYVTHGNDFFDVIEITDNEIIHAKRELINK